MDRYTGKPCPHCGKPFTDDDSLVVCPDCGAPYHRACFEEIGKTCLFADRHAEGFDWAEDRRAQQEAEENREAHQNGGIRCGRCGTLNAPEHLFCEVCGASLRPGENDRANEEEAGGFNPFGGMPFGNGQNGPFQGMGFNPYTTPYGGVDPDDEIEGVPVKELVLFVGENTPYYLPKFKEMTTNKRQVINWSGFFFDFLFLIYRKMYLLAAIVFLLSELLPVLATLLVTKGDLSLLTADFYSTLSMISYGISFAIRFFVGFSFNRLYLSHCLRKIRKLKEQNPDTEAYHAALTKHGSVSRRGVIIFFAVYMALTFLATYVIVLFTPMV